MTTKEYAAKYGLSLKAVYHKVYGGRVTLRRVNGNIDIDDTPPAPSDRWRLPEELLSLPDYELALLWYTATICGTGLIVRNTDCYFAQKIAEALRGCVWSSQRNARGPTWVYKADSRALTDALRSLGFTGRKDPYKMPPPTDPLIAAQALLETHSHLGWALQYERRHRGDKRYAYYIPEVGVSGSEAIINAYAEALCNAGIIPPRKLSPAANGTTKLLYLTAQKQLRAIYDKFSTAEKRHAEYWERYERHISSPIIPHNQKRLN